MPRYPKIGDKIRITKHFFSNVSRSYKKNSITIITDIRSNSKDTFYYINNQHDFFLFLNDFVLVSPYFYESGGNI